MLRYGLLYYEDSLFPVLYCRRLPAGLLLMYLTWEITTFRVQQVLRVATCQGKVREKQNFLQVRELSGNFEKMSGNFGHLTNVREMSGNFVMTIKFFQK